jgi:hypothetical protein
MTSANYQAALGSIVDATRDIAARKNVPLNPDGWKLLQDSGVVFASPAHAEDARVALAKYIIEAAKLGDRNQLRLRDDALAYYAKSIVKNAP